MSLRKKIKTAATAVLSPECSTYQDCLEQAETCSDQARQAARLRRYRAARGLFSTAIQLYRRAIELAGGSLPEATDRLHQVEMESSVYTELARSMERPLLARTDRTVATPPAQQGIRALT